MKGFVSKWLVIAVAALAACFVALALARTFGLGPLLRERLVVTEVELESIGTRLHIAEVVGDRKLLNLKVEVNAAPRGYRLRVVTLCVADRSVNAESLTRSVEGRSEPLTCSQEQTSREEKSSFTVLKSDFERAYLKITFENAGGIKFWGTDVRQYLIPARTTENGGRPQKSEAGNERRGHE